MNIHLIGGTGRSGTTILTKIFSCHPEVAVVPEWRYLVDPDGIIDYYVQADNWSPYHSDVRIKRLRDLLISVGKSSRISGAIRGVEKALLKNFGLSRKLSTAYSQFAAEKICPNYNVYVEVLINNLVDYQFKGDWAGMPALDRRYLMYSDPVVKTELAKIFRKFLVHIISSTLKSQDKVHYLEKNTWNILWFEQILDFLPESKLVHIYRDPRDVCVSFSRQVWMPDDVVQCALIYKSIFNEWEKVKARVRSDTYFELSLESLVENRSASLSQICEFWSLPWHDSLNATKLDSANTGRWKTDIDKAKQERISNILSDVLEKLGYE
jgi:hypothetical protein